MNLFGVLGSSLTYENVLENSHVIVEDFLFDLNVNSIIDRNYLLMQNYCVNNSEYVFSEEGYVFNIPCDAVLSGKESILDEGVKSVVHQVYYDDYSKNVTDYIKEPQTAPLSLISKDSYDYTNKVFYSSLSLSLILIIILFLLVEKKSNTFLLSGIFILICSLIFIKIEGLFSLFSDKTFFQFLGIFFSQSFSVSVKFLIFGILLIIFSVIFKIFKLGFWISSIIEKVKVKMQKPSFVNEGKPKSLKVRSK